MKTYLTNSDGMYGGIYRALLIDYNDELRICAPCIHQDIPITNENDTLTLDMSNYEKIKNRFPTPIWNVPNLQAQQHEKPIHPCWITFECGDAKRPIIMGWLGKGIKYNAGAISNSNDSNFNNATGGPYKGDISISSAGWVWPAPEYTRISSGYGARYCKYHGNEHHAGVDLAAPGGSAILASKDGTVYSSGDNGDYGNTVILKHSDNTYTRYSHANTLIVSAGDVVSAGDKIATVGTTGTSTGNHLHFGIYQNGLTDGTNDLNPFNYIAEPS